MTKARCWNQFLRENNEALRAVVYENKEVLSVTLETGSDAKRILEKLQNSQLEAMNDALLAENATLEDQLSQCRNALEVEEGKCNEEIDELESKNFVLTNLLEKQDHVIADLENKLRESQKPVGGICVQEKYELDPTQQALILHHELQASRNAFKKLTKGVNAEINKNTRLERYCRTIKEQNEYLASVIKTLCVGTDKPTDNTDAVQATLNLDMEKLKGIIGESVADPATPEEAKAKADVSMSAPHKEEEVELSFASSMGSPMPAKNDLSKSHDRIKGSIPVLDLSKIKGAEPVAKPSNPKPLTRSFIEPYGQKKKEGHVVRPELAAYLDE